MRTLAVLNQKGGTTKTSTAVNVAAALGELGKRVLVVDLDPQASASSWLGVQDGGKGLFEVFTEGGKLADLVTPTPAPGVDVVPSSAWLVGVEKALSGEPGAEGVFRRALSKLPPRWDFVFVDCPPTLGLLSVSALVACREVFVPVEPNALSLAGLAGLLQTVERVRDRLNPDLEVSAVVVSRVDERRSLAREVIERLRERFGDLVLRAVVHESVRIQEAWSFSKPVTLYASKSRGAEDFRAVAGELLTRSRKKVLA